MAKRAEAFAGNAPGAFFVDTSCIDCGTCYAFAPETYADSNGHSRVAQQPADAASGLRAAMALLACPTSSIGTDDKSRLEEAAQAFPDPIDGEVHFCGYTSEKSFGAWSWFIRRAAGNVLVDSPRAAQPLLNRIAGMGGLAWMVLSHRDDIADHVAYRDRFACERVMHRDDGITGMERMVEGFDPIALDQDLLLIPVPGHTPGSLCLLYQDTYLFTGDHLWWNPRRAMLSASKTYNWHSWPAQLKSLERLLDFDFQWVLPGHGHSKRFEDACEARCELERGIAYLRKL